MTVAELGNRMSAHEEMGWAMFERTFGPITLQERLDALIQVQTGEKPEWRVVPRWTDDNLVSLFDAMARH